METTVGQLGAACAKLAAGCCRNEELALPDGAKIKASENFVSWLVSRDEESLDKCGTVSREVGWQIGHPLPAEYRNLAIVGITRYMSVKLDVPEGVEHLTWDELCSRDSYGSGCEFKAEEVKHLSHWLSVRPDVWVGTPPTQIVGWKSQSAGMYDWSTSQEEVVATLIRGHLIVLTHASWVQDDGGDIVAGYGPEELVLGAVTEAEMIALRQKMQAGEDPREWRLSPAFLRDAIIAGAAAKERRQWHGKIVEAYKPNPARK